jgi:hypothetical protein
MFAFEIGNRGEVSMEAMSFNSNYKVEDDFRESLYARVEEIMKCKWYPGESKRRNRLECKSMGENRLQWIKKLAIQFREYCQSQRPAECS